LLFNILTSNTTCHIKGGRGGRDSPLKLWVRTMIMYLIQHFVITFSVTYFYVLAVEATNTNFLVFGLTRTHHLPHSRRVC